ncbi:MAG TPA: hypothetical protein VGR30_12800 [Candidatus Binatia bacterium]|jgi:hypothetical protein|nr:hypothetical protein [Candidatus Binatia bacterium]
MEQEDPLEATLEDLIMVLTEESIRFFRDEKEAYKIVAFILTDLFRNSGSTPKSWH